MFCLLIKSLRRGMFMFLVVASFQLSGQVFDDFSDENFLENPTWNGDTSLFKISFSNAIPSEMKPGLQLDGSDSDTALLYLPNQLMDSTEWLLWVKQSFNSSSNNHSKIYIVSDQSDFRNELNGYYIQIGGANDSLELYKQNGPEQIKLISGSFAFAGNSTNVFRIKVTYENGLWKLFTDSDGGFNFQHEGSAFDNSFTSTEYFGIVCRYTSSNSSKFYFDDVFINKIINDTVPPQVINVIPVSLSRIDLLFSEALSPVSSQDANNYLVEGVGSPGSAELDNDHPTMVQLKFDNLLESGNTYTIIVKNIADLNDNVMYSDTIQFVIPQEAMSYDIVINEIMADPNPPIGLPEYEYIELFNITEDYLNISGWKLMVGSSEKDIPDFIMAPNEYVIFTDDDAVFLFGIYAQTYGFTSLGLINSGTTISLFDANDILISQVVYDDSWYGNTNKLEGGWSLEQIDPFNPCLGKDNWSASEFEEGGSPGELNSIDADNGIEPDISNVYVISENNLQVWLSQKMDKSINESVESFFVDKNIGIPEDIYWYDSTYTSLILSFNNTFTHKTIYELSIAKSINNCVGIETTNELRFRFGLQEEGLVGDVVINEVLFNPLGDGVDFVEVYNNSEKIIDFKALKLGSVKINQFENNDTSYKPISNEYNLLLPQQYAVIAKDPEIVMEQYWTENPTGFLKMEEFPQYNNESGVVVLQNDLDDLIDFFNYHEEMHHPLLNSVEGVSLERINFNRPTSDNTNWHSASETVGYATPCYQNSQYSEIKEIEYPIVVDPEIFSPDNDGYNDIVNIHYYLNSPGYTVNITIYDSQGRLIKSLIQNKLLGTEGFFSWDGTDENNQKSSIGIYVIYFEGFDTKGNVIKYKKPVVLAGKL